MINPSARVANGMNEQPYHFLNPNEGPPAPQAGWWRQKRLAGWRRPSDTGPGLEGRPRPAPCPLTNTLSSSACSRRSIAASRRAYCQRPGARSPGAARRAQPRLSAWRPPPARARRPGGFGRCPDRQGRGLSAGAARVRLDRSLEDAKQPTYSAGRSNTCHHQASPHPKLSDFSEGFPRPPSPAPCGRGEHGVISGDPHARSLVDAPQPHYRRTGPVVIVGRADRSSPARAIPPRGGGRARGGRASRRGRNRFGAPGGAHGATALFRPA